MKNSIVDLHDALLYYLKKLYSAEKIIQKELKGCIERTTSEPLKAEMKKYQESTELKLSRIKLSFDYLMQKPADGKDQVVAILVEETHDLMKRASTPEIRDVLLLSCLQTIVHHKIACYGISKSFSIDLTLQVVTEWLHEVLELEKETDRHLVTLAIKEVNEKLKEPVLK